MFCFAEEFAEDGFCNACLNKINAIDFCTRKPTANLRTGCFFEFITNIRSKIHALKMQLIQHVI